MKQFYIVVILAVTGCFISVNAHQLVGIVQNYSNVFSPQVLELKQNFPNPFNPTTQIEYFLSERSYVEVNIYNILGIKLFVLVNTEQEKGWYKVKFNAEDLPAGLYIYELQTPMFKQTRKMLYLK